MAAGERLRSADDGQGRSSDLFRRRGAGATFNRSVYDTGTDNVSRDSNSPTKSLEQSSAPEFQRRIRRSGKRHLALMIMPLSGDDETEDENVTRLAAGTLELTRAAHLAASGEATGWASKI